METFWVVITGAGVGTTGISCLREAAQHLAVHISRPAPTPGTKNSLVQNIPSVEVEKAQPRELTILSFSLAPSASLNAHTTKKKSLLQ